MNLACSSQPISYLRLERYLQGDVAAGERARVAAHLDECALCRRAFEDMRDEVIQLPPLPSLPARPARWRRAGLQLTAALGLAAAIALWLRPAEHALPRARVPIKGGELGLELVRERAGVVQIGATRFEPDDRWQARVSCPPGAAVHWQLVVFQADRAFFPLVPSAALACANGVTLPGAFALDGRAPADVCVAIDAAAPLSRERLASRAQISALTAACVTLSPSPR